jgi:hypothetical protein
MKRDLRLEDLKDRSQLIYTKLLSVRVPVDLIDRIDQVVERLSAGKGEVVVALLNEGLGRYKTGVMPGAGNRQKAKAKPRHK